MIRQSTFRFVAIAAAALSICGALAIVHAQAPNSGLRNNGGEGIKKPSAGGVGMGKMPGMSYQAADDDPEMTQLAQAEADLADVSGEIVARFAETEKALEREQIATELRDTLAKQFDVQMQRRELELGRIEDRVRKLRAQIKKRADARETIIDRRRDQLINEVDGLGWAPAAVSATPSAMMGAGGKIRARMSGSKAPRPPQ